MQFLHVDSCRPPQPWALLKNISAAVALAWCCWLTLTMTEVEFFKLTDKLQPAGVFIAYFDGACMLTVFVLLLRDLRTRCTPYALKGGAIFFVPVLAANMLDFFTTIIQTPDLSLETNPVWNSINAQFGLELALQFGLWGKVYLSLLAATCFAFYLQNAHTVLQDTSQTKRSRALATVFAFYFAMINLFCFYIAYANWLVTDLPALRKLPEFPAAICIALVAITMLFFTLTVRAARKNACRPEVIKAS
jgi:hypothetical protein